MTALLMWLEDTALSVLIREHPSLWSFPFVLFLHTLGLGVVAGLSVALNLWVLTFARRYPGAPLHHAFPLIWLGFAVSLVSGVLLLIAYPTKALTDPVFYLKIILIIGALWLVQWLRARLLERGDASEPVVIDRPMCRLAVLSLLFWAGAVLTGRFLAYTYNYLTAAELVAGS